ncbi:PTS sugar transporter subunit IIA [Microvirga rosea]|uniref:PTS sugar transporter subunit IIA n=1 Tax=Microvirga rosea TaxID=2715425 RepID=UPI001D0BB66E|nr:PTS sugar transporter subunit IIA [Microvirga rosea]MCB8819773.1 PTS sugar transporter subunit IIA [Microvirga rosea]
MRIEEFLQLANVIIDLQAHRKEDILEELARRAGAGLHRDWQTLLKAMYAREALGTTGVGDGIAIPHVRLDGIDRPFGILARLKRPIEFEAVDAKPVDILFFLVLPHMVPRGEQLSALACVARRLREQNTVGAIRRAPDAETAYHAIVSPSRRSL